MKTDGWNIKINSYNRRYTEPFGFKKNVGKNNMILTNNVFLSLNTEKTHLNNNVFVINENFPQNSSEFIKSNLLQHNCNFVVLDTGGNIIKSVGRFLWVKGYNIKTLDLTNLEKSDWYNPFSYIQTEKDVRLFVDCIIKNTISLKDFEKDPFFEKSERALLQSLISYIIQYRPLEERKISTLINLLCLATKKDKKNNKSELDKMFDRIACEEISKSMALKQYLAFKLGAGKNKQTILSSVINRMKCFSTKEILRLTNSDTIHLNKMNNFKSALFIVVPETTENCHPIVSIIFSQLSSILSLWKEPYNKDEKIRQTRIFYDNFASIGIIPEFSKTIACSYKTNTSHTIIAKNIAQIKSLYRDDWESIIGCSSALLCFGCKEYSTVEYVSKELGKKIVHTTTLHTRDYFREINKEYKKVERHYIPDLMSPDEIVNMKEDECVLIIKGLRPFKCKKYNYKNHPYYKRTGDYKEKNIYTHKRLEIPYY